MVVLFEGGGEGVRSVVSRNEIEIVRRGGRSGGMKRRHTGIRDRSGREAGNAIGVVRRFDLQVGLPDIALPPAGELERVDHRRIGAEEHVFAIAVEVDRGDHRPLLRQARLRLDDGGERDGLVQIQSGGDVRHLAGEVLSKILDHRRDDRASRGPGIELVGIGEQITLERGRLRSDVANELRISRLGVPLTNPAEAFRSEQAADRETIEAFSNRDALQDDIAADQFVNDVGGGDRVREFVYPRFHGVTAANQLHVDQRHVRVAHDSLLLQMSEDRSGAQTLADLDVFFRTGEAFVWRCERAPVDVSAGDDDEHEKDENRGEGGEVLSTAAPRPASTARCYDVLRMRSSRYD